MKTCPICRTTLFADMQVCFGCMYRFGSKPELETVADAKDGKGKEETVISGAVKAEEGGVGQWTVRIEMRNGSDPDQAWSIELAPPFEPKPKDGAACVEVGD